MPTLGLATLVLGLVASAATAQAADLVMRDLEFVPREVRATAGTDVTVENVGAELHTATSRTNAFHVQVAPGASGTLLAPIEPGRYDFVCAYHPEMTGTLVVAEARPKVAVRTPAVGAALGALVAAGAAGLFPRRR